VKALVIGSPVSHSLSPAIFSFISHDQKMNLEYQTRDVKAHEVESFFTSIRTQKDFVGMNVTIPLKEVVLPLMNTVSSAARAIGAVNVIYMKDGLGHGDNTDVIGIEKTFSNASFKVSDSVCLLWGAGGSAKAVAFVLGERKARKVYIFNRGTRGVELAQQYSQLYPDTLFTAITNLSEIKHVDLSLMINTTPLGMQGQESGYEYFSQARSLSFSKNALAFDLIYVPAQTDFLKVSEELGLKTVGGLGMLIDQALATWEIWIAPLKDIKLLHDKLNTFLKGILKLRYDLSPIYLTGFMGAGKSTVGKRLSEMIKREFVDTDSFIEQSSGKTIAEIFLNGEEQFREMESEAIKINANKPNTIISLGGGSLKLEDNLKIIKKTGRLIYLKADPMTLESRVSAQNVVRPLLKDLDTEARVERITSLLAERESYYSSADLIVNAQVSNPMEVCFEVISKIGAMK
jgi:shikimate dehydrogenase